MLKNCQTDNANGGILTSRQTYKSTIAADRCVCVCEEEASSCYFSIHNMFSIIKVN